MTEPLAEMPVGPMFTMYRPALTRYFRRKVRPEDVEDLVHEVFLNLQARRAGDRIENVEAYLFTIARNVLTQHARSARARNAISESFDREDRDEGALSPERTTLDRQLLQLALDAIERLPPRTRDIFVMHRFSEKNYAQIARDFGISTSAVEKHIMAALKTLVAATGRSR